MINLSDTHISVANIQDLRNPTLESEIELAPYYNQIYRFGDYLVEQVQGKPSAGARARTLATFRVKRAGGDLDDAAAVATLRRGPGLPGAQARREPGAVPPEAEARPAHGRATCRPSTEAVVVDLRDPDQAAPGRARWCCPRWPLPYYRYWCGMGAYWGGFWFQEVASFAMTEQGFAFFVSEWRYEDNRSDDDQQAAVPRRAQPRRARGEREGAARHATSGAASAWWPTRWRRAASTSAPQEGGRDHGRRRRRSTPSTSTSPSAGSREGNGWAAVHDINTPGPARSAPGRAGRASGCSWPRTRATGSSRRTMNKRWVSDYRLSLLRQVDGRRASRRPSCGRPRADRPLPRGAAGRRGQAVHQRPAAEELLLRLRRRGGAVPPPVGAARARRRRSGRSAALQADRCRAGRPPRTG